MDFRCDQSRGVHFIYYLPFTQRRALVESTLFSPSLAPEDFYDKAIKHYLANHLECTDYTVKRRERGVIPYGELKTTRSRPNWNRSEWRRHPTIQWIRFYFHPETD